MYIVTKTHNFDPETEATAFETREEAEKYLQWVWEDYVRREIAEESDLVMKECYHEEDFAKVQWTDGCQTWFHLFETTPPRADFLINRKESKC